MKWLQFGLIASLALVGVFALSASSGAEQCTLELKYLDSSRGSGIFGRGDYLLRTTYPQSFFMQLREGETTQFRAERTPTQTQSFSKIVKKEPSQYVSKFPFRGVITLGTDEFGFVLDAKPPEAEEKDGEEEAVDSPAAKSDEKGKDKEDAESDPAIDEGYARLFFDANHNGDLTDDEVVEAERVRQRNAWAESMVYRLAYSDFPRVKVAIEADGTKLVYAFSFSVRSQTTSEFSYASAALSAAAYREGEITLEGKKRQIVLLDFNSNGRFDDMLTLRDDVRSSSGKVSPSYGDILLLDPAASRSGGFLNPYDVTTSDGRYQVGEIVGIDGRFYDLKITPAGDKLSLTPSSAPMGKVSNPNDGFRAVVYGDRGVLKITGGKSQPATLPEGKWKLLSYTIDRTIHEEKEEEKEEEKAKEQTFPFSLGGLISRPRYTMVSAQAAGDGPAVEVREGKTVKFPFGPPYKPVVESSRGISGDADQVSLALSLVGTGGEICTNLVVDGGRPEKPEFTITTPDGKEVDTGKFEYG
jgi:hypothetical protein